MKRLVLILMLIILLGCAKEDIDYGKQVSFAERITGDATIKTGEGVALLTDDGKTIYATYMRPRLTGSPSVIMLHMLGWDQRAFRSFANRLNYEGYGVITLDMRGHGDSLIDLKNWHAFDKSDFNDMIYDVEAAVEFLKKDTTMIDPARISIMGTSLGANIAAKYTEMDNTINSLILISPGLEYKGVNIEDTLTNFTGHLLITVGTRDDYSYESSLALYSSAIKASDKQIKTYISDSHGVHLLDRTDLKTIIMDFLEST